MKYITSIKEFEEIDRIPYSIVIYSSIKSCHPCRLLKKWIEEEYTELEHIFYVDIHNPKLSEFTNDIYALPTVDLVKDGIQIKRIEGFIKPEIELILKYLIESPELKEQVTPLIIDTDTMDTKDTKDVISLEFKEKQSTPTRSMDEIIHSITKHLNEY
jgi:hypothetical protein